MKRQIISLVTLIFFIFTPKAAYCESAVMEEISNQNGYSWSMSDEDQVTQMKGMILWGFLIAIASAVIVCIIPNSTATPGTSTTGSAATQGTNLF